MKVNGNCVGCGQCVAYCPSDAIIVLACASMNEKCTQCGKCIDYCPMVAISEEA
ncbi:MAG: 4Fe-4S binding protein [Candidatus Methanoperedens sp.]|nr:4Fe-4S binding protein [Candidatus Methanoperedens sp.]